MLKLADQCFLFDFLAGLQRGETLVFEVVLIYLVDGPVGHLGHGFNQLIGFHIADLHSHFFTELGYQGGVDQLLQRMFAQSQIIRCTLSCRNIFQHSFFVLGEGGIEIAFQDYAVIDYGLDAVRGSGLGACSPGHAQGAGNDQ